MITRTLPLIGLLVASMHASGQYLLATGPDEPVEIRPKFVSLDEQGRALGVWATSEGHLVLQQFASDGTLIWSRHLIRNGQSNWNGAAFASDDEGGLWCATSIPDTSEPESDTASFTLSLAHVSDQGELVTQWGAQRRMIEPPVGMQTLNDLSLLRSSDGSLILRALGSSKGSIPFMDVHRFQPDGTLNWARSVGNIAGLGNEGLIHLLDPLTSKMTGPREAPDGGLILGRGAGMGELDLFKLTPQGAIEWSRSLRYTNAVFTSNLDDIAIDLDGTIHTAGYLGLPTGGFLLLSRTGGNGDHLESDLCTLEQTQYYHYDRSLALGANGERSILNQGSFAYCASTYVDALDAEDAQQLIHSTQIDGDDEVRPTWSFQAVNNGHLVHLGTIIRQHSVLAFTTWAPALALSTLDANSSCFDEPSTTAMVDVPTNILEFGTPEMFSSDLGTWVTDGVSGNDWTISDAPLPEITDACLTTGINPVSETDRWLINNVVCSGDRILFARPMSGRVEIHSSSGALVLAERINGTPSLAPGELSAGVYLLNIRSTQGQVLHRGRVIVVDAH